MTSHSRRRRVRLRDGASEPEHHPHDLRQRALAAGGVIGPAWFVAAWAIGGALRHGYSPIDDAISRLAEVGAGTQAAMTSGLVAYGLGVGGWSLALRRSLPGPSWVFALVNAAGSLAVAALPLGAGVDAAHGLAAGGSYVALAGVPLAAVRPLRAAGRVGAARASALIGAVVAVSLSLTVLDGTNGLFQRLGLTAGDVWIVAAAIEMLRSSPDAPHGAVEGPSS